MGILHAGGFLRLTQLTQLTQLTYIYRDHLFDTSQNNTP